ncbi:hypothetical protein Tco_0551198 [Tanacetum coccineum]
MVGVWREDSGCWPDMVVWMIMTMLVEWWSGVEMMKVLWGGRSGGGSSEVAARWEKAAGMEVVSWGCEGDEMMWTIVGSGGSVVGLGAGGGGGVGGVGWSDIGEVDFEGVYRSTEDGNEGGMAALVWGGDDGDDNEGGVMVACGGEAAGRGGDGVRRVTKGFE